MLISQESIQRVLEVPVEDIVSHYIHLKQKGHSYESCCPFHDEKTPSFRVTPSKGIFKCFGCGEAGNGLSFAMKHKNLSWREAIEEVASFSSIKIEYIQGDDADWKEKLKKQEDGFSILQKAVNIYKEAFPGSVAEKTLLERGIQKEDISFWNIGYAPGAKTIQKILKEAGANNLGIEIGILKVHNGTTYDTFNNRIMFPIRDHRGHFVGFGGRIIEGEGPKYMNSPESAIYDKSKILYGLFENQTAIKKSRKAVLVEGYMDVISLCRAGVQNTVASCGTSFTERQAKLLKKYTDTCIMFYDGDNAGIKAGHKSLEVLIKEGLNVFVVTNIPEGKDPDNIANELKDETGEFIEKNSVDAILFYAHQLYKDADGPSGIASAKIKIAELISLLPSDVVRNTYIDEIQRTLKFNKSQFRKEVETKISARIAAIKTEKYSDEDIQGCFPRTDEQRADYLRYGFWEEEDEKAGFGLYFAGKNGNTKLSNFLINSLFRIEGVDDSKRIFSIRNVYAEKIVDLPTQALSSLSQFTTRVESMGNFVFEGGQANINKLKLKLYANETHCKEIKNLGWQPSGFWAFANGVYDGNQWCDVNSYGIAEVGQNNYFIAALSNIYAGDDQAFISDKRFIHIKNSNVSFELWSKLFINVHGDTNGLLGVLFFAAAIFRDYIIKRMELFPHLFLFGQPATGKSQLARGLIGMFGKQQDVFNLNSGTNPGFFKKLGEFANSIVFFDEYTNTLDEKRVQLLKSSADGVGHIKSESTKDERTISTPVRSSCVIAGQQLPNLDIALFTRCILCTFGTREFDLKSYDELKDIEQKGITSVTLQIIAIRKEFEREFHTVFDGNFKELKGALQKENVSIDDRIIRNYSVLLTLFVIMEKHFKMPMSLNKALKILVENMKDQNALISGGNDVNTFWDYVEYLFSERIIEEGRHFKFEGDKLLIRFKIIHKLYHKHFRSNTGKQGMDASSLQDYLKNSPEWMGTVSSTKFQSDHNGSETGSAYVFDYTKLEKKINLVRIKDTPTPNDSNFKPYGNAHKDAAIKEEKGSSLFENTDKDAF